MLKAAEKERGLNPYVLLPTGRRVPLSWREEREADFQRLLREGHVLQKACYCLCRSQRDDQRRLAIRQLGGTDAHWYLLARYPQTGFEHDPRCDWFEPHASATGRISYENGVIRQRDDGTIAIRLGESLEKTRSAANTGSGNGPSGGGQAEMTLRGLLDLAWEQTGLETWRPQFAGKRSWYAVNSVIHKSADGIVIAGHPMTERLAIITPRPTEAMVSAVHSAWDAALTEKRGILLLGELSELKETDLGKSYGPILLHTAWGAYHISLRAESALITQLRSRWVRELMALANPESKDRVIALLHVRPRTTDHDRFGFVVAGALMRTTEHFIPAASNYEATVAKRLVAEGRMFRKPMRYDGDGVFPDFELLDTPNVTPMEVFGRNDVAYATRRDEKIKYYADLYGAAWWSWDATASPEPPPFPRSVEQRKSLTPSIRI